LFARWLRPLVGPAAPFPCSLVGSAPLLARWLRSLVGSVARSPYTYAQDINISARTRANKKRGPNRTCRICICIFANAIECGHGVWCRYAHLEFPSPGTPPVSKRPKAKVRTEGAACLTYKGCVRPAELGTHCPQSKPSPGFLCSASFSLQ
jgi:hypothetical protein